MNNTLSVKIISDTEIEMSRTFNFPRELVFQAHTSAEHVKNWWGQRGSELIVEEMDFRPGGAWRFVSREKDGNEYPFKGEFKEIVPPEKIVQTFIFDVPPFNEHWSEDTLTLTEVDGKTIATTRTRFSSKEARDGMLESGMEVGAAETYDRLEEYLATLS